VEYLFQSVESMLSFPVQGKWSAHDLPHLTTSAPHIPISILKGANSVQRECDVSILFNDLCMVTGELRKASDVGTIFLSKPVYFLRIICSRGWMQSISIS